MTNPPNFPPSPDSGSADSGKGFEYPPLDSGSAPGNPYPPVDYPPGYPAFPPPVYGVPYPGGYPVSPGYPYPGDPYDPYRQLKPPGTNGKAIAALVSSIAGIMCCGVSAIAGIILGIIAMKETKRTGQDGFGLAVAGVAIGGVVIAFVVVYFVFMVLIAATSAPYN